MRQTPWGRGHDAGEAYIAEIREWHISPLKTFAATPRPPRPASPYPLSTSKHSGSYQWQMGFNYAIRANERFKRETGK